MTILADVPNVETQTESRFPIIGPVIIGAIEYGGYSDEVVDVLTRCEQTISMLVDERDAALPAANKDSL